MGELVYCEVIGVVKMEFVKFIVDIGIGERSVKVDNVCVVLLEMYM